MKNPNANKQGKRLAAKTKVVDLAADVATGQLSWSLGEARVSVVVPRLMAAMADREARNVYALGGPDAKAHPTQLMGFSSTGAVLFSVGPPAGFIFSYLTQHPSASIAVVAIGDPVPGGFSDWHFSVSPKGELEKVAPAY